LIDVLSILAQKSTTAAGLFYMNWSTRGPSDDTNVVPKFLYTWYLVRVSRPRTRTCEYSCQVPTMLYEVLLYTRYQGYTISSTAGGFAAEYILYVQDAVQRARHPNNKTQKL